jgi:cell division protein ZipA
MEYFGWVLALISVLLLALIYAYSTGFFKRRIRLRSKVRPTRQDPVLASQSAEADAGDDQTDPEAEPGEAEAPTPKPLLAADSKVVAIRVVPEPGDSFGAEHLILKLRSAGFKHGEFDIFHKLDPEGSGRIRYSVASLVEPGSFDLSKLKESTFPGVTMFMVLPAPEDGLALFDEMMAAARNLGKELDGRLIDEQGSALSVQRERYMREEVIEFLRQQLKVSDQEALFEFSSQ